MSVEEKEVKLRAYVSKIVSNLVSKVECSESQGGRYGLCFMCHKSANYYCKDTKVPVCSVLCKKEHLLLLEENQAVTGEDQRELQLDIEEFLHTQLTNKRSPALCADFLTTIYLFS